MELNFAADLLIGGIFVLTKELYPKIKVIIIGNSDYMKLGLYSRIKRLYRYIIKRLATNKSRKKEDFMNSEDLDIMKKLIFNEDGSFRNVNDIYETVTKTEIYKTLDPIGHHLQRVIDYGNIKDIDNDPFTKSVITIAAVSLYIGVAASIQVEFGLHSSEIYQLEYEHSINTRAYVEQVGRVHKGAKLIRNFLKNKDMNAFVIGCKRLIAKHSPDNVNEELRKIFQSYYNSNNDIEVLKNSLI